MYFEEEKKCKIMYKELKISVSKHELKKYRGSQYQLHELKHLHFD